jgi:hypothetical protein
MYKALHVHFFHIFLGKYLAMKHLGVMVSASLTILEIVKEIYKMAEPFCSLTTNYSIPTPVVHMVSHFNMA